MRNLIQFIVRNTHWLFFLFLMFISILLIVNNNDYQQSKFMAVENEIVGKAYSVSDNIGSYVRLKQNNDELMEQIASLQTKLSSAESLLEEYKIQIDSTQFLSDSTALPYEYIPARIIKKNILNVENYVTLNKGSDQGVKPDMGVMGSYSKGIVGVVKRVSKNFSVVIPVLNPKFKLSCKLKGNTYSGPLVWDHLDTRYASLEELPRHIETHHGDTIVTSGNSAIFQEGIPVGTVESAKKQKDDNFNSIRVKLFTNLGEIDHVLIVKNNFREEQLNLEKESGNVN